MGDYVVGGGHSPRVLTRAGRAGRLKGVPVAALAVSLLGIQTRRTALGWVPGSGGIVDDIVALGWRCHRRRRRRRRRYLHAATEKGSGT